MADHSEATDSGRHSDDQPVAAEGGQGSDSDPSLEEAFEAYRGECECGEVHDNNCAHFLSDALIRAGFDELDGGEGLLHREHDGRIVCKAGRPVRARELREWFQEKATETHEGDPGEEGYWAVFQLDEGPDRYWGGHVAIHHHDGESYDWVGTGNYPDWEHQEHYTW